MILQIASRTFQDDLRARRKRGAVGGRNDGRTGRLVADDERVGRYRLGGSGAGEGFSGTSGVHTHMTNTRITDAEIMELRYPVYLNRFEIRENSGGNGEFQGGDGIIREVTFLDEVEVSLLRQHQIQKPYGLKDGESGKVGKHLLKKADGTEILSNEFTAKKGDILTIWTPGGGGFGSPY